MLMGNLFAPFYLGVIANQFGNDLIVIMSLPLLTPPPPRGRGRK